jgi:class 3 adenylate cyclase
MERVFMAKSAASTIRRKAQRSNSSKAMSLSLQSLPGISTFTDRAVIGMLKSYAGIHRDRRILKWNDDFRLGAGVGAFKISMIFGMDAGWAVEGAVGSEYKIDATYLSPHVNMASRMTSACKQYDVTLMLSQSVQELMSDVAQSKLRHVDTVTVKGSSTSHAVVVR